MTPHNNVRAYRPRQVPPVSNMPAKKARPMGLTSPGQWKLLGATTAAVLIISLGLMQFFHARIVALQVRIDRLQTCNAAIAAENKRIEAVGDQVGSRSQVVALAKRKLNLFEPDHGQVHRM